MATHVWQESRPAHSGLYVTVPSARRVEAAVFDAGRVIFGGFFLYSGINHLWQVGSMTPYAAAKGVPFPELAVVGTGLLLIVGSLSLLSRWPRD